MLTHQNDLWRAIQDFNRVAPLAWPAWLRQVLYAFVCVALFGLLWLLWLSDIRQDVLDAQATHARLRAEFSAKLRRAAPLSGLQMQQSRLALRIALLEKKLPGQLEINILLADMGRAGRLHNLRYELIRPAEMNRQLPYGQQQIALRVTGRYQDLVGFTADLAELNWLVSVQSFTLVPSKDGALSMDAIVRTFRPLNTLPNANDSKEPP